MKKKPEYYWINIVNMCECMGPFKTVGAAIANVKKSYRGIDVPRSIAITQFVQLGHMTARFRWVKDDPDAKET